jgi:sulfur carrier protein ThiS
VRLHLGGHLSWYDARKRADLDIHLREPIALATLLDDLKIPAAEIAIVAVNGDAVALEKARVRDADRVELYPPVGGGSGIVKVSAAAIIGRINCHPTR